MIGVDTSGLDVVERSVLVDELVDDGGIEGLGVFVFGGVVDDDTTPPPADFRVEELGAPPIPPNPPLTQT